MLYYKDLTDDVVYAYDETEASQLPYIQQAIGNGWEDITGNWPLPPEPTSAEENKAKASQLLLESDWVTLPDVLDPNTLPYLTNQAAYLTYRAALRVIAVNPVDGDIVFPVKPISEWIT